MNRKNQRGSAHVVVTICLVVALITALGWIFYQNFIYKAPATSGADDTVKTTDTTDTTDETATTEIQLANEGLYFTIPNNWKADIKTVDATEYVPTHDDGVIKNASGTAVLSLTSGISGVGGYCEPDSKEVLTITETAKTKATSKVSAGSEGTSKEIYAVKSYYYSPSEGYAAFIFLTSDESAEKAGTMSTCLPKLVALFNGRGVEGLVSIATQGGMNNTAGSMKFEKTKEDALATLDSDDMKQVYSILQTAHY